MTDIKELEAATPVIEELPPALVGEFYQDDPDEEIISVGPVVGEGEEKTQVVVTKGFPRQTYFVMAKRRAEVVKKYPGATENHEGTHVKDPRFDETITNYKVTTTENRANAQHLAVVKTKADWLAHAAYAQSQADAL